MKKILAKTSFKNAYIFINLIDERTHICIIEVGHENVLSIVDIIKKLESTSEIEKEDLLTWDFQIIGVKNCQVQVDIDEKAIILFDHSPDLSIHNIDLETFNIPDANFDYTMSHHDLDSLVFIRDNSCQTAEEWVAFATKVDDAEDDEEDFDEKLFPKELLYTLQKFNELKITDDELKYLYHQLNMYSRTAKPASYYYMFDEIGFQTIKASVTSALIARNLQFNEW